MNVIIQKSNGTINVGQLQSAGILVLEAVNENMQNYTSLAIVVNTNVIVPFNTWDVNHLNGILKTGAKSGCVDLSEFPEINPYHQVTSLYEYNPTIVPNNNRRSLTSTVIS